MKGGIFELSHDQQKFSFELNESLYFEKGQEVEEMIQIALEPEISIQPFNEYVSIRGVIELQGEYQKVEGSEENQQKIADIDNTPSQRFMERITDIDVNTASFSHRFPVEISVPSYRVKDMNQITVSIESFDYEVPMNNQLNLTSTIDIHGLNTENSEPQPVDTRKTIDHESIENHDSIEPADVIEEQQKVSNSHENETRNEIIENEVDTDPDEIKKLSEKNDEEIKQTPAIRSMEHDVMEETNTEDRKNFSESEPIISNEEESFTFDLKAENQYEPATDGDTTSSALETQDADETSLEKDREKNKKSQTLEEFFESTAPSEGASKLQEEEYLELESTNEEAEDTLTSLESSLESKADVSYLSDMFRDDDSEEQYARMRLCIVQDKDTIESIAERYQIPTLQLLKQNQLDGDDLFAGQLLYIPNRKK